MDTDRDKAGRYVLTAAQEILNYCHGMTTPFARSLAYVSALDNIEKVRKKALRRGDELQTNWCHNLHKTLRGGA
jgi:hypothetical protein